MTQRQNSTFRTITGNSVDWVKVQKKTFENWANECLKEDGLNITNIKTDFKDSLRLYIIYQNLTGKKIKNFDKKPKRKIQILGNLNLIINSFKKDKVKLINVQGEDIHDENLKIILGFTWMLIQRYHIIGNEKDGKAKSNATKILLEFVNNRVPEIKTRNFTTDWKDGELLAKLIESIEPNSFPEEKRPKDSLEKIAMGIEVANQKLEVPKLIEPEYIEKAVDKISIMTYVSALKNRYNENVKKVHGPNCVVSGDIKKDTLKINEAPHKFEVELRNIYDEPCPVNLEDDPRKDIDTVFTGPGTVQLNTDNDVPGRCTVTWEFPKSGLYNCDVRFKTGGDPVKGSPFKIKVETSDCRVKGAEIKDGTFKPNEVKSIDINTGTTNSGLIADHSIVVRVTDPEGNIVETDDHYLENGIYKVNFIPKIPGKYNVQVHYFEEEKFNKDFYLEEEKKEYKIKVKGEIFENKKFPDNRATGLLVKIKDKDDKKQENKKVEVIVTDSNKNNVGKIEVEEKGKGKYEVNIDDVTEKGEYEVKVLVEDEEKKKVKATCEAGTQPELVTGTFTFEVHARDKKGNPKTSGGDIWQVNIDGPNDSNIDVETKDLGDGRYTATYTLQAQEGLASTFKVHAKLNGSHVGSSPFKHELAPKPSVGARLKNFFKKL